MSVLSPGSDHPRLDTEKRQILRAKQAYTHYAQKVQDSMSEEAPVVVCRGRFER